MFCFVRESVNHSCIWKQACLQCDMRGLWAGRLESCFITLCHISSDLWSLMEDTLFLPFTEGDGKSEVFCYPLQTLHCALEERITFFKQQDRTTHPFRLFHFANGVIYFRDVVGLFKLELWVILTNCILRRFFAI